MLHLTNTAVVALPEDTPVSAFDIDDYKKSRGLRVAQSTSNISWTPGEQIWMHNAFVGLVASIMLERPLSLALGCCRTVTT